VCDRRQYDADDDDDADHHNNNNNITKAGIRRLCVRKERKRKKPVTN
jgi:hypothetical protein